MTPCGWCSVFRELVSGFAASLLTAEVEVLALSLGMKQKLALAQAMMEGPHVLNLDEAFNGLD